MAGTCQACEGAVCEICGGRIAHGECSCIEDKISDLEKQICRLQSVNSDLLDALKKCKDYLGWHYYSGGMEAYDTAEAAIAKASQE